MASLNRLLIVDDDNVHRMIYSTIAHKVGFSVDLVSSLPEADAALRSRPFDCVVLDLMLGEHAGADVLEVISTLALKPKVLLVSGASQDVIEETFAYGRELGIEIIGPVRKPVDVALLRFNLRRIANALEVQRGGALPESALVSPTAI
jgi:DNA-binding response OmpR family regulator